MANEENLWVLPTDLDPALDLDTIDPGDVQSLADYEAALSACEWASQALWAWSGRKYHTRTVPSERYIVDRSYISPSVAAPVRGSSVWDRSWSVFVVDPYDWKMKNLRLSGTPIRSIGAVTEISSGRTLDPTEFSVVNHTFLRVDTDLTRGIDVTYTYGIGPTKMARMAALAMAREFYFLWSGRTDQCKLPTRVTSVNRQNVSWVLLDQQDFLDDMRTGIYAVDMFLRTVNPNKAQVKAKVFSVDIPRGRRHTL